MNNSQTDQIYFNTFTEAVCIAREAAEAKGYTIDESDWDREVTFGVGRPKNGSTTRITVELTTPKLKRAKRYLAIQVYDMGRESNTYELNWYIS